jgi:type II secretory pathway pseudopilin PulG
MNTVFVVVVVVLVVIVVTAAGLLLRSIAASPKQEYRRSLRGIRQYREEIDSRATDPNAVIRVNRDDWLGTSDHLG